MGMRESLPVTSPLGASGPIVAELVGLVDGGDIALVIQTEPVGRAVAKRARTTVELNGAHIGAQVLLLHENDNPELPIVVGVLRRPGGWPLAAPPGVVELESGGTRLTVSAREQLTLRCGSARITLTHDGKVLIEGRYVCSQSTGVNCVRGGSVHLN